ncbi:MAG: hypothetical protein Q8L86_12475 [Vicinamibacterales bacterium]|nr:hypothetical protein [Vicinamibacterales bacterium]
MQTEVLWSPNSSPQRMVLQLKPEDFFEVGYGGARGGGKTAAGIAWLLYDKDNPHLRALIIRKQSKDLNDWIDRARQIYEPLGAVIKGNPAEFHWPSGAIFRTGHLNDAGAYSAYVGHEYQRMLIEELNLIPSEENYLKLISSCRSTVAGLRPQVMSNFNPSDAGFYWIRKRFGLHGIPRKAITMADPSTGLRRIFIPALTRDNPALASDPQYNAFLNGLPDGLRQAWRDGSWDDPIIKGAYYANELDQARREGRLQRVPYDPRLKVHTVWDLGIDDAMSIGFWQHKQNYTALIDYYENENFGLDHYRAKLEEFARDKKYSYGKHFAPHDVNRRELSTGKTIIQLAAEIGLKFEKVPMVGVADGIQHVRLMFPRTHLSEPTCEQAVNAFRNYRREYDEELLKFKDTPVHDWSSHAADMLRYASLVEDEMTNEGDIPQVVIPPRPRESIYEGVEEDDGRHPMFRGVDIGKMGHEKAA